MSITMQEVVPLTTASTDEQLRAHLTRNWNAREPIQAALVQAYTAAKSHRYAPIAALDAYYLDLERAIYTTRRNNSSSGSRNAEDWNCEMRVLRLSLEGLDHFTAFSARWEKMSDGQRLAEREQARADADHKQMLASMNHARSLAPQPVFNPAQFLQRLEEARIRVTTTHKGDLVVTNAGSLTPEQRIQLKTFKAGIVQALGATETF